MIKRIWNFSIHPTIENHLDNDDKLNIIILIKFILIFYGLEILGRIPSIIVSELVKNSYAIELIKFYNGNMNSLASGLKFFFISVIFGPLLEEIIFRLWLSFKRIHVTITFVVIFFILLKHLTGRAVNNFKIDTQFLMIIGSAILLGSLIGYFIFQYPIKKLISNNFKYFYWFSCIGFGLLHITNFPHFT